MKPILMCLLLSVSLSSLAQGNIQTFISPDGAYQFTYPTYFVRCSQNMRWFPWGPEDCASMIPVCLGSENTANVACVAYPKARYKDYPEFEAAAFSVAQLQDFTTEKDCLKLSDALVLPQKSKTSVVIHGVSFKVFEQGGSAGGSSLSGRVYHAFHDGKCYELATGVGFISTGLEEPIKHLTKSDWKKIDKSLWQVAQSFRFLK